MREILERRPGIYQLQLSIQLNIHNPLNFCFPVFISDRYLPIAKVNNAGIKLGVQTGILQEADYPHFIYLSVNRPLQITPFQMGCKTPLMSVL